VMLALATVLAGCSELTTVPPHLPDANPTFDTNYLGDSYHPPPVLTSSGDTCAGWTPPADLSSVFWAGADEELVSNPDSVWAADSARVADPEFMPWMALIDESTGAELYAGPCEVMYNRCIRTCRRLKGKAAALCWAACMARYSVCLADEEVERRRKRPPDDGGCSTQLAPVVYEPGYEEEYSYSAGCGSGGGSNCRSEWVVIEVDWGDGVWRVLWTGFVTVCDG
jgi:hypothetical protein